VLLAALHQARIVQANKEDEEANAHANCPLECERNGIHNCLPQPDQHQNGNHHPLQEDDAHRRLPGQPQVQNKLKGDHRVQPQAGRKRKRVVGVQPHRNRHHTRSQACCGDGGGEGWPLPGERTTGKHGRIDRNSGAGY
jgi:hypothetical protein